MPPLPLHAAEKKERRRRKTMEKIVRSGDKNHLQAYIQMTFSDVHPDFERFSISKNSPDPF